MVFYQQANNVAYFFIFIFSFEYIVFYELFLDLLFYNLIINLTLRMIIVSIIKLLGSFVIVGIVYKKLIKYKNYHDSL
jgi:hypothetical protein